MEFGVELGQDGRPSCMGAFERTVLLIVQNSTMEHCIQIYQDLGHHHLITFVYSAIDANPTHIENAVR
jgi:hypothetical protein